MLCVKVSSLPQAAAEVDTDHGRLHGRDAALPRPLCAGGLGRGCRHRTDDQGGEGHGRTGPKPRLEAQSQSQNTGLRMALF